LYSSIVGGDLVVESCTAQEGVGGGLHAEGSNVDLADAWFIDDSADQAGGAIHARSASTVSLTGGGISGCTAGDGGALFASRSSMVSLAGTTVQANRATSGSGGGFSLLAETPTDITTLTLTACDLGEKSSDNEPADLQVTAEDGTTATCSYGGVTTLSVTVDSPACP
ncbi:MAG: hypothetical protein JXB39_02535, partial [Deltaproteobacteria bacterium]|nr:hypothetical protein [Deltaproteobacteria bacterium]